MKERNHIKGYIYRLKSAQKVYVFFLKNKEAILYLFFGGLAFLVSIFTYIIFEKVFIFSPLIANVYSWIITVTFAYVTNKVWVFESHVRDFKGIIREITVFFSGRIVTLLIEEAILFVGIDVLSIGSIIVKIVAQIVVIISNYFASKLIVFKK